jgi:hypothetical protein
MGASDNTAICAKNYSTFQIPDSSIVPGYALLSDYTTVSNATSSTGSNPSGNHNVAIGVGVGVPLGLIALAAIAWALWERRKLNRYKPDTVATAKTSSPYSDAAPQSDAAPPQQAYNMAPMNTGAYGQPAQTYNNNNQYSSAPLSEMETRGPVELDSRK